MEVMSENRGEYKGTLIRITLIIGCLAFTLDIISVIVPHWGQYSPERSKDEESGFPVQDHSGHFGPFQSCGYNVYYDYCGGHNPNYHPTGWLIMAGLCAIISTLSLAFFNLFAFLHLRMRSKNQQILANIRLGRSIFLQVLTSSFAVMGCILSVLLGAFHFAVGAKNNEFVLSIGIMYVFQIILVFVTILLLTLSVISWNKWKQFKKQQRILQEHIFKLIQK